MPPRFTNPVVTDDRGADHGDPFVLRHRGEYFLYHTTDDGDRGISVHRSADLVHWEFAGHALEPGGWAQTDVWAPEVVHAGGEFLMYVSATTIGPDGEGIEADRRQGLARAPGPLGPFRWDDAPLVRDAWSIDGHPFRAADGSDWLFYNVRTEETRFEGRGGSGNVVDRLLAADRLAGAPAPVVFPSERWEGSAAGDAYWNEGAWVIERRGRLHQMYSGGFYREATYGIGTAWADDPRGPWTKDPANPIFASGDRITGPGHHSVAMAPDGVTPYVVYHAYDGDRPGRKVHLDRLHWCGDRPALAGGRPTEGAQPLPPGPVHDPAVPHWHAELWAEGAIRIAGVDVDLGGTLRHVQARQGPGGLRVLLDGTEHLRAPGVHRPELPAGAILTSHLEDEAIHRLVPGTPHVWPWGGGGPLEITLAVRGEARLPTGEHARGERGRYSLLRALLPDGAGEIRVEGDGEVTDLVATART
jgi:GH43 family beta-xylosidase